MSQETRARRKREATEEEFCRLLKRLDPVEQRAWEIHDTLRRKLIWFFESDFPLQAEDLAEETLDRIARKSDSYEIRNVTEFAFGVARNLRREISRRNLMTARLATSASINSSARNDLEQTIIHRLDFERKLACFNKCLQSLDAENRRLLSVYYPKDGRNLEQSREALARELGTSSGALKTRIARLRVQLEKCFEKCCASPKAGPRNQHPDEQLL